MNFLAHIYLSYNNPQLTLGNFIADAVKGKRYLDYPAEIQKGILLHRQIDSFTDQHPVVRSCKRKFHAYRHYSGVITDVIFDHFLAKNWAQFQNTPLKDYSCDFYKLLESHYNILPPRIQGFYPVMKKYNWLLQYQSIPGINNILWQMNIRSKNISKMNYAVIELRAHYAYLEENFFLFFKELEHFAQSEIKD